MWVGERKYKEYAEIICSGSIGLDLGKIQSRK